MSTRDLAQALGHIEVIYVTNKSSSRISTQPFDFLLVLDFEATCWDAKGIERWPSEIIEFPVVLYDVNNESIKSEFQQYVRPTEKSILSEFCTTLTGIQQRHVDNGVPIAKCVIMFQKWLREQIEKYNLTFDEKSLQHGRKKCAFVTWSDWDLGTCLRNELRRKRYKIDDCFNKWIDLRALYKRFYNRKPKGLNGALMEVGLKFKGREHCGLHDARNTAFLAKRMIDEGVLLEITQNMNK